VNAADS